MTAVLLIVGVILLLVTAIGLAAWLWWQRRQPTGTAPVQHEGATEQYAEDIHQAGRALPSAELRTTAEQMIADHAALDGIGQAVTQFDQVISDKLRDFCGDDLALYLEAITEASLDATGELDLAELRAVLAGVA